MPVELPCILNKVFTSIEISIGSRNSTFNRIKKIQIYNRS